jgi:hypothetical protein
MRTTKICRVCERDLMIEEFRSVGRGSTRTICKECEASENQRKSASLGFDYKTKVRHAGESYDATQNRECRKCQSTYPATPEFFAISRTRRDGLTTKCKDCMRSESKEWRQRQDKEKMALLMRKWHLKRYGLTIEQYDQLVEQQGSKCAICQRLIDSTLVVDHDHDTNLVRGLLCDTCNRALGLFGDDYGNLYRAAQYLQERKVLVN